MANKPSLPLEKRKAFIKDALKLSDTALAKKYELSERTAYNWRVKLIPEGRGQV